MVGGDAENSRFEARAVEDAARGAARGPRAEDVRGPRQQEAPHRTARKEETYR